jgi:exoribonuclease R
MIVDYQDSQYVGFNGSTYCTIPNLPPNTIFGKDLSNSSLSVNTFYGIIHFSSKYTYKSDKLKPGVIQKECSPFIKYFPKILVKTKRTDQKKDMYALLKIVDVSDEIVLCDVVRYIEEKETAQFESDFIKFNCTAHWTGNKIVPKFQAQKDTDLTPIRKSYQSDDIYSIDPPGCVDIDDALHCKKIMDEDELLGYEVGIHIADVSSFIEENNIIDNELKQRVETIYLPNEHPIHMIPEQLAINYISLLEKSPKRAFSIIIRLNIQYEIQSVSFEKTVIEVKQNLSYEQAEEMIKLQNNESIQVLYTVGRKLKEKINFAFSENEIYDTHQMVAVYMIYANKFVGEKIQSYDPTNVLLRAHQAKSSQNQSIPMDNVDPVLLKKYNSNLMDQAKYQIGTEKCEHHGLNLPFYTHFTSPIRRYADIIVHRHLWKVLNNEQLGRIETKTIFLMNFYSKFYKQMEKYYEIMVLAEKLGIEYDVTDAYITFIDSDRDSIKLYIPKYKLDYNYQICNYKMKDIISVEAESNKITIKNNHSDFEAKLNLFQKVQVKLVVSTRNLVKVIFQIIELEGL